MTKKQKKTARGRFTKNLNKIRFGLRLIGFDFLRPDMRNSPKGNQEACHRLPSGPVKVSVLISAKGTLTAIFQ